MFKPNYHARFAASQNAFGASKFVAIGFRCLALPMKPLNECEVNIVKAMVAAVSREPPGPAVDKPSGQSWFDKHEAILRHSLEAAGGRIVRGGPDVALWYVAAC